MSEEKVPEISLKMESREVKSEVRKLPSSFLLVESPWMLLGEYGKPGTRKLWTKSKWKIFLYYLWRVSGIRAVARYYNQLPQ